MNDFTDDAMKTRVVNGYQGVRKGVNWRLFQIGACLCFFIVMLKGSGERNGWIA